MAKFLLIGGAGFIGSHVARILVDQNHEVAIFDSFIHYVYPLEKVHIENVQYRLEPIQGKFETYRGETLDLGETAQILEQVQPDCIIHLAAMPLANMAIEHPETAVKTILNGTMNLLQAIRMQKKSMRFVYISSSMVYGDFKQNPVPETSHTEPKEIYGAMKLAGEHLSKAYGNVFDVEWTIIRPSAVYGPTDNNRRVIGIFLENALAGNPLTVKGQDQALDFTFVTDTAQGIVLASQVPKAAGQIFNITRGEPRKILEAAEIIAGLVPGTEIRIEKADAKLPVRGQLDTSKAQSILNYAPQVSLEEGIRRYHAYLLSQMG